MPEPLIWRVMTVAEETEDVFRDQWGRLLALLVAQFRRLDLAEDGLADAFAAAADRWPTDGVPRNPAGWLLTAARRRILDRLRAEAVAVRKEPCSWSRPGSPRRRNRCRWTWGRRSATIGCG